MDNDENNHDDNDDNNEDARSHLEDDAVRVGDLIGGIRDEILAAGASGDGPPSGRAEPQEESGSELFEREKELSILESLEKELAEIQAAIERIENGTYGTGERTGSSFDSAH
jgi:RNA polymerase-binding transcription factor DksA